jgi:hypothetical protein
MKNLIEKLKSATTPDRELDSLIARSLEQFPTEAFKTDAPFPSLEGMYWVLGKKDTPNGPVDEKWSKRPLFYTASIDAALTLVPEGLDYVLRSLRNNAEAIVEAARFEYTINGGLHPVPGVALCLALCIAALKAREQA